MQGRFDVEKDAGKLSHSCALACLEEVIRGTALNFQGDIRPEEKIIALSAFVDGDWLSNVQCTILHVPSQARRSHYSYFL